MILCISREDSGRTAGWSRSATYYLRYASGWSKNGTYYLCPTSGWSRRQTYLRSQEWAAHQLRISCEDILALKPWDLHAGLLVGSIGRLHFKALVGAQVGAR